MFIEQYMKLSPWHGLVELFGHGDDTSIREASEIAVFPPVIWKPFKLHIGRLPSETAAVPRF